MNFNFRIWNSTKVETFFFRLKENHDKSGEIRISSSEMTNKKWEYCFYTQIMFFCTQIQFLFSWHSKLHTDNDYFNKNKNFNRWNVIFFCLIDFSIMHTVNWNIYFAHRKYLFFWNKTRNSFKKMCAQNKLTINY